MPKHIRTSLAALAAAFLFLTLFAPVRAGWMDTLKEAGKEAGLLESSGLTNDEMIEGLKEALSVGVDRAVNFLGQPGGYLNHEAVRIPVPDSLDNAAKVARTLGKDELVDDFVVSMNQAAERAVPEAVEVFTRAIKEMSFEDARKILDGPDDAATRYFERNAGDDLTARFLPIVDKATDEVGVTRKYKDFTDSLGPATKLMDMQALDLDAYVTEKGLDGLFLILAREEKKIRENPAARTTEILKKVFGSES